MYLSKIQSIERIQESYDYLFKILKLYKECPDRLKSIIELSFRQITSWKIANGALAAYPTPYVMELSDTGIKSSRILKKTFKSLAYESERGYNSCGFYNDNILLDVNPLREDFYNVLSCYIYEDGKITRFAVNFYGFELQNNQFLFSQAADSVFDILAVEDFFWLSNDIQVSVSINNELGYHTSAFVYDDDKGKLKYVVREAHYHDSVTTKERNSMHEWNEYISLINYDSLGRFIGIESFEG